VGRFVRTVAFFNKPPSPGEVLSTLASQPARIFSALAGGPTEVRSPARRRRLLQLMLWFGTFGPMLRSARAQEKKSVILPLFGDSAMSAQSSSAGGNGSSGSGARGGVVLVSGATGGVGKRVVQVRKHMEKCRKLLCCMRVALPSHHQASCHDFEVVQLLCTGSLVKGSGGAGAGPGRGQSQAAAGASMYLHSYSSCSLVRHNRPFKYGSSP
jgi:hypothetical protein